MDELNTTEIPSGIFCQECKDDGKGRMHMAVTSLVEDLPEGKWNWQILNHDKTVKFQWPRLFSSKDEAWSHIQGIMDSVEEDMNKDR